MDIDLRFLFMLKYFQIDSPLANFAQGGTGDG
jgi:hypothetical protein